MRPSLRPFGVTDQLSIARESIRQASEMADQRDVQDQLKSLDEGIEELTSEEKTQESDPTVEVDRLEQVEEKLAGLLEETDGAVNTRIEEARDAIDVFRQEHTNWEE